MVGLHRKDMGALGKRFVNTTVTAVATRPFTVRPKNKRFPGNKIKLSKTTCLLFNSGKLVIIGAKCFQEIDESLRELQDILGHVTNIKLRNVVGTFHVGFKLDLYHLLYCLREAFYEPELFNGLTVKISTGATCNVFHSGKVIVTGTRTFESCDESINMIFGLINESEWTRM